jgi:hypothetical protein
MSKFVDIHFRAEGDDARIATLHEDIGALLERGWVNPFRKGYPMSDGTPAPTNYTSVIIAEGVQDTPDSRMANPAIIEWLSKNQQAIEELKSNHILIQVCVFLEPAAAYDGFYFDKRTIALASKLGCGLEVMAYRLIKEEEIEECQHVPPVHPRSGEH